MRKLITFLLVTATVALSLLTAIMMFSATDIFPLPSDFQESAASIISRIPACASYSCASYIKWISD